MTDPTEDELSEGLEQALLERPWRRGTLLRFNGRPQPNEYVVLSFAVGDWFLSLMNVSTHKGLRCERSAFEYVRTMPSGQVDVLEVMTE